MKLKNTKIFTLAATLIAFGSLVGGANAALQIIVSDAGSGQLQFQLSGSDVVVSSNYTDDEIWFHNSDWTSYPINGSGYYNITSGGFNITTTQNGVLNGTRVYYDAAFGFGLDTGITGGESKINLLNGDVLSWTGTFTIAADFSYWSSASYDDSTLDVFGDGVKTVVFSENVTVSTSAIPELSSVFLVSIGFLGVFFRRRRTA